MIHHVPQSCSKRRRRGNGSCCPAASSTSGWILFELELLDYHYTFKLTLIRIRLGKTWAAIWFSGGHVALRGHLSSTTFASRMGSVDWLARIPVTSKASRNDSLGWMAVSWVMAMKVMQLRRSPKDPGSPALIITAGYFTMVPTNLLVRRKIDVSSMLITKGGRPSGASAMIITTLGTQQTFVHSRTIYHHWFAEKQHQVISFIHVRVHSLGTVNEMSFFQDPLRAIHAGVRSRKQRPFICFWCLNYEGPPPTTLGATWNIFLRELLLHCEEVQSGFFFWKRSVSPSSPGVVFWFCFWLFLVGLVFLLFWKTPGFFAFTFSPTCGNS